MGLIELMASFVGIICVFIISYGLFLMRPYSEPIVTEGKIVEKYMFPDDTTFHIVVSLDESIPLMMQTFYIVVLLYNGYNITIQVGTEYDTLELDDHVEITEYSRMKRILEKKTKSTLARPRC